MAKKKINTGSKKNDNNDQSNEQFLLWNHYKDLRDELIHADSLNYKIIGVIIGAVAAIFNVGLFKGSGLSDQILIFLTVYVITISGFELLKGNRKRTWRISTYMRVYLEPRIPDVKWETRMHMTRKEQSAGQYGSSSTRVCYNEWLIITLLNWITGAAICAGLIQIENSFTIIGYAPDLTLFKTVCIIVIVLLNVLLYFTSSASEVALRRLGSVEQTNLTAWCSIRYSDSPDPCQEQECK